MQSKRRRVQLQDSCAAFITSLLHSRFVGAVRSILLLLQGEDWFRNGGKAIQASIGFREGGSFRGKACIRKGECQRRFRKNLRDHECASLRLAAPNRALHPLTSNLPKSTRKNRTETCTSIPYETRLTATKNDLTHLSPSRNLTHWISLRGHCEELFGYVRPGKRKSTK